MAAAAEVVALPRQGWLGRLELRFASRGERTALVHRRHQGPLMVQSAFHPEGAPCHVYLLHPPGGVVGGDALELDVALEAGAHALLTTPASTKLYRSVAGPSRIEQQVQVSEAACLEFLPAENIAFDGACCRSGVLLDLAGTSRAMAWDAWVFGRPASDISFDTGELFTSLRVRIDGVDMLDERTRIEGGSAWFGEPWGLGGHPATATLVAYPATESTLEAARSLAGSGVVECEMGATLLDGLLVTRVIAGSLRGLREAMEAWWRTLRPEVIGREAVAPRIWAT